MTQTEATRVSAGSDRSGGDPVSHGRRMVTALAVTQTSGTAGQPGHEWEP